MKKLVLTLIIALAALGTAISQEAVKYDSIFMTSNDTVIGKITEVTDDGVKFRYPGEDFSNALLTSEYKEIRLSSGRVLKGAERIEIRGIDDWAKVVLTTDEDDVKGLEKIQALSVATNDKVLGSYADGSRVELNAKIAIKKQAAELGCHIVLITGSRVKDGDPTKSFFGSAKASISGVAYRYPYDGKDVNDISNDFNEEVAGKERKESLQVADKYLRQVYGAISAGRYEKAANGVDAIEKWYIDNNIGSKGNRIETHVSRIRATLAEKGL